MSYDRPEVPEPCNCGDPLCFICGTQERTEQFVLGSSEMVHTPGLFRYLQCMYRTDPANAIRIIVSGWPMLSTVVAEEILNGTIETTIDDTEGTVTFEV